MKKSLALALAAVCGLVLAQPLVPDTVVAREAAEHARIRKERGDAQVRFLAQDVQCYQRFAVNDCLGEVRTQRRAVLAELRRQEISLNEAQRKRRAAEQLLRADDKAAAKP